MNCENFQDLLSAFIDGSLIPEEYIRVEAHLRDCGVCAEARRDLDAIVVFCRDNRGRAPRGRDGGAAGSRADQPHDRCAPRRA